MLRQLAVEHLALRLKPLNRALRAAVERQARLAERLARPDVAHLCITDDQVQLLLDDADAVLDGAGAESPREIEAIGMRTDEAALESTLRARAAAAAVELPLDALARLHGLSSFEQDALLLCAAPEVDRGYERIFGYVHDDMNRRVASIELLFAINAVGLHDRMARRRALGPYGILRRTGMLRPWGDAANELRQEFRLGNGMLDCLCGEAMPEAFRDRAQVDCRPTVLADDVAERVARLGRAVREGCVAIVGVWGPARSGHGEVAQGLALAAGRPLRRLVAVGSGPVELRFALDACAALGAVLWIATEGLPDDAGAPLREHLADALAASPVAIVLTGATAWRPLSLLAVRSYAELRVVAPDHETRQRLWAAALPDTEPERLSDLANRYRVGPTEVAAATATAYAAARMASNGHLSTSIEHIGDACASVLRPSSQRYLTLVEPRRGPENLILPPALHQQVLEVAAFFRAWPRVSDEWGFGRLMTGRGGIKALFTGDSGTGKTLAAEVVAGQLGMPLLKIDLSQIVSKWVGETEKHLEAVFTEAEDSHGVLFFDEADALFGKRGEVRHGVDRYANLEVSYLLQRIEDHAGLVILASNLKDNIDAAFTRRFQAVIQFPRPQLKERQRIWEIALPAGAALKEDVDLDLLARLDLTGAGITGAARTAALLAAADGCDAIGRSHIARAIARQYQSEARVLMPAELGVYAGFLQDSK